jgi:hypothetical protein
MNKFFISLTNMLRLRSGPQDFSSSWILTLGLIAVYLLQNLVIGTQFDDENIAAKSILLISLQVVVLAGLLYWFRHTERFSQTLSALAAVGIIFNFIAWALLQLVNPEINQPALGLAWIAINYIWSPFVDANIYRHALSVTLSIGVLIAVVTLAVSYVLIEMLFLGSS